MVSVSKLSYGVRSEIVNSNFEKKNGDPGFWESQGSKDEDCKFELFRTDERQ